MSRAKNPLAPPAIPAPTRSDSAEIVEAIVAAAIELGDPDASINDLAARAGVGVASIYRYFPNKSAIYAELSRRLQREGLERVRAVLARPSLSIEEAVEACCRAAVVAPKVSPAIRRSLNMTLPLSWSEENAQSIFRTTVAELTAWLAQHLRPSQDRLQLQEQVFIAFAAARGLVMMSQLLPDLAPKDEDALVLHLVRGTLAYLEITAEERTKRV